MVEIELKFQIPAGRVEAVRRELGARAAAVESLRLRARYFDTEDERLARAGLALRLRKEGRSRWVQTLKGRGDGMLERLEHELVIAPGAPPAIELARHDGTPAGAALRAALGASPPILLERFATDIRRSRRVVRARGAAGEAGTVEIALDEGRLVAPAGASAQAASKSRVCEIEFELIDGSPQALLALASRWVRRHGLWLDVRSKAERGHALATGRWPGPVLAQPPRLARGMSMAQAFAAMLKSALAHVLPNHAAVAEAVHADAEHLHQLRVGLRRLRTLLREFGEGRPGVDAAWGPRLAEVFGALGRLRDRGIVEATLQPAREAAVEAGAAAPSAQAPPAAQAALGADETAPLREPAFNALLLSLIGLAATPAAAGEAEPEPVEVASRRLARLHKRVAADAERFAGLDDPARHALRKRLKRLRYSLEFVAPLFPKKAVSRYLARLKPAQQALGEYNDLVVAQRVLREPGAAPEPFVLGWLAARREGLAAAAATELGALAGASPFWKKKPKVKGKRMSRNQGHAPDRG